MSSEIVYYDIVQKRFVYNTTGYELAIKDYPSITFKEQKIITWNVGQWDSNTRTFTNIDLTQFAIHAWQSSVDYDFTTATAPMIRALNANIDSTKAKNGIIVVTYNADTKEFEKAVDGQPDGQRKIYIELKGYDANGKLAFFSRPRLSQVYGEMQIDPGIDPVGETTSNYYTKSEGDGRYATRDDIPENIESTNHKNQANGYAGLDENCKLAGTQLLYGTNENSACQGNDSRLSDSRAPTAHASSHITGQGDAIQSADAMHDGLMTSTQANKLETIELNADVTHIGNIGSSIHGANTKNTPIDNDEIAIIDSTASNVLKKTFWSSIKSVLKNYFDTFYFGTTDTPAQGDILYHNGSAYKLLPHGTDGQFLKTQGVNNNPVWATPSGAGDTLAPQSNTDNYVPQWNGINSKTLKNGYPVSLTPGTGTIVLSDELGKVDAWISDASTTAKGKVELATSAETTTGIDTIRAITADGLRGSDYGKRIICIPLAGKDTAVTTGDGKNVLVTPPEINGWDIISANAATPGASSTSGNPQYMIRNATTSHDILSTPITIDANEYTSYTAATPSVISSSYKTVSTGDLIMVDKDAAGTGEKGDLIYLVVQKPGA